jgi:hypothetical protein
MLNLSRVSLSTDPLNVGINARVEQASLAKHANDLPRGYLGASLIGETCLRKIQFDWMTSATFSARLRSIFARGHYFEAESRQQLIDADFVFAPAEDLGFVIEGGLIAGHADGIILAVPDDVKLAMPALWECKGLNGKNYRAVERDGLAKVFPRYAAQVAIYQHFLGVLNPALMTIVNADTCERLHFTVAFDARLMQETIDRAFDVINATRAGELLPRFDQTCEDFRCKMCSHRERCLGHD